LVNVKLLRCDFKKGGIRIGDPDAQEQIWEMRTKLLVWAKHTADFAYKGMERSFANPDSVDIPRSNKGERP